MVAKPGTYQANCNAGELADALHGRTDLKQFYAGLARMRNAEPVPQGGGRLAPRTRHLGRIRNPLTAVVPQTSSQALGPHAAAAVIATLNFGAPSHVAVVRLTGLAADVAVASLLQVEWNNGSAWQGFGGAFSLAAATTRDHTVALAPGAAVAATGIRLRQTGVPDDPATYTLAAMTAFVQSAAAADAVRLEPFTFAADQSYVAAFTDGHVDFTRDGDFVGAALGVAQALLPRLDVVQRDDTMLLFHEELRPRRIMRNGADDEWPADNAPFTDVPRADLGGVYGNGVTDKWEIYIRYPSSGTYEGGIRLVVAVTIDGEETAGVATGEDIGGGPGGLDMPDWPAFATALAAAIEALPSVAAGITVTQDDPAAPGGSSLTRRITVEFTGAGNEGRKAMAAQVANTAEAAATVVHAQIGRPGGEDLMSAGAGWPACGGFFNDRLILAGFKGKKRAWLASATADYYNLNTEIESASGAMLHALDTAGAEQIIKVVAATHLILHTDAAEYFVSDRALVRGQTPNHVQSSRNGALAGVPIVESGGDVLYVGADRDADDGADRTGTLLYGARYDDVAAKYVSDPKSLLAFHIATDIVDLALQKFGRPNTADRLWLVRADGTVTVAIILGGQDVFGFLRWETAGAVKAVCVDGKNRVHLAVERTVGDTTELHLERAELGLIFDDMVTVTNDPPSATVGGLAIHEGATVWATADGHIVGPFTVADAAITLPFAAGTIEVGRWTAPSALTLPLPAEVAERVVLKRPRRVHTVRTDLIATTSLAIGANAQPAEDRPLYRAGDATDDPLAPFTGTDVCEGLVGFTDEGQVEITQLRPGALQWRGLTIEART